VRRARGFTLIELMVSLGLAGLVVAGALQLHAAYNVQVVRRREIGEIQQTLRLAMGLMARQLRSTGLGTLSGTLNWSSGTCTPLWAFQYVNAPSSFADPPTVFDSTPNDTTTLPDAFKVITADDTNPYLALSDTANQLTYTPKPSINFGIGDLVALVHPTQGVLVREVTAVSSSGSNGIASHASPGVSYPCANPATDPLATILKNVAAPNDFELPMRHFGSRSQTWFRILPQTSGGVPPRLVMQQSLPNKATANGQWLTIAENVEDMQIAVLLTDGSICNTIDVPVTSSHPSGCNFARAAAVRITLVGRSPVPVSGLNSGQTGGYEDEVSSSVSDGYLRRAVTETVELRN
jgi:prepilin-type N-terminal cleavage/methylation domain-containing protein